MSRFQATGLVLELGRLAAVSRAYTVLASVLLVTDARVGHYLFLALAFLLCAGALAKRTLPPRDRLLARVVFMYFRALRFSLAQELWQGQPRWPPRAEQSPGRHRRPVDPPSANW